MIFEFPIGEWSARKEKNVQGLIHLDSPRRMTGAGFWFSIFSGRVVERVESWTYLADNGVQQWLRRFGKAGHKAGRKPNEGSSWFDLA